MEAEVKNERPKPKRRRYIVLSVLLITIVLIAFGGKQFLNYQAQQIFTEALQSIVQREVKGLYDVSFSHLNVDLFDEVLEVENLQLTLDSLYAASNPDELNGKQNIYQIKIPEIEIGLKSLWGIYADRELLMKYVRLSHPDISITHKTKASKKENLSLKTGQLYDVVSNYVNLLKIDSLSVENARLVYEDQLKEGINNYTIQDFSFSLSNFQLDSAFKSREEKILLTDRIDLSIYGERFPLPDGLHEVIFDTLEISTYDSTITLLGLKLKPLENLDEVNRQQLLRLNFYDIELPRLTLKGIDFSKAYNQNILRVDSVTVTTPKVFVDSKYRPNRRNRSEDNRLFSLLTRLFDEIEVKNLNLSNAKVEAVAYPRRRRENLKIDQLDLNLTHLKVDKRRARRLNRGQIYRGLEFTAHNTSFELPDSVHALTISKVYLSTEKSTVIADSIRLKENQSLSTLSAKNQSVYRLVSPKLVFEGFDIKRATFRRKMVAESVTINNADISIFQNRKPKAKGKKSKVPIYIFPLVRDYVNEINVNEIKITNSDIDIRPVNRPSSIIHRVKGAEISLKDIQIDSLNYAQQPGVFNNLKLFLNYESGNFLAKNSVKVSSKGVMVNSEDGVIETGPIQLAPASSRIMKDSVSFGADTMYVSGIDFISLLTEWNLYNDSLYIKNPSVSLLQNEKPDSLNSNRPFPSFGTRRLIVENALLDIITKKGSNLNLSGISMDFNNFRMDSAKSPSKHLPFLLDTFSIASQTVAVNIGDRKYNLKLDSIGASTVDSTLNIYNVELKPDQSEGAIESLFVPLMRFEGFDFKNYIHNNQINARDLTIPEYKINLSLSKKEASSRFSGVDIKGFLKDLSIPGIGLKSTSLQCGELHIATPGSNKIEGIHLPNMAVELKNFALDTLRRYEMSDLLEVNMLMASSDNFILLHQGRDTIPVGSIMIESATGQLNIEDIPLDWSKLVPEDSTTYANGHLKSMSISGLDVEKLICNNQIEIADCQIELPNLAIDLTPGEKGKSTPSEFKLGDISSLEIHELKISNDTLKMKISKDSSSEYFNVNQTAIKVTELQTKNLILLELDSLLAYANYDFRTRNYSRYLNDSLFLFSTAAVHGNTQNESIHIDSVRIDPRIEKEYYARLIGHQTDWMKIKADQVVLEGLDLPKLFNDDILDLDKIIIDGINWEVFRDKRISRIPNEKDKKLPVQALMDLDYRIAVDSILVNRSRIMYEEFSKEGRQSGAVEFTEINGQFSNLTNMRSAIAANPKLDFNVSTRLMDKGDLKAQFSFDLQRPGYIDYTAELGAMDLTALNRMLEHNAFVKIIDGKAQGLSLTVEQRPDVAFGEMYFRYKDLKVRFINKKNYTTKGFGKSVAGFFANTLVNTKNPTLLRRRKGDIYFERIKTRSIFNYWSKTIGSGLISSVGIKKHRNEIRRLTKSDPNMEEEDE
ncbi:MAG: hypothetical protein AAFX87_27750 [Bacteroidota bacterium]